MHAPLIVGRKKDDIIKSAFGHVIILKSLWYNGFIFVE